MTEKYFAWDEISEELNILGVSVAKDEEVKGVGKQAYPLYTSKIYCPHSYLILDFHETLNQNQKIKFRKHYLRKVSPNEPNIIILQDIKDLVMFLLITPVSLQFINFFHLPIVDRFLRALIIYFQYYIEIYEKLMLERAATMKKAPNPLAGGHRHKYADELQILRCIVGREYADLLAACQDKSHYHHMLAGRTKLSTIVQSQGEKDLRIFEVLIAIAHRVVWIALLRKHYNLIEIELHRLFRTDAYNSAERRGGIQFAQEMLKDDIHVLHGSKAQSLKRLLGNSPVLQELIYSDCDFRLLSLGTMDGTSMRDSQITYLQNVLLIEEEKLSELEITIGILGQSRLNYDVMLIQHKEEKSNLIESQQSVTERYGKQSYVPESKVYETLQKIESNRRLPCFKFDYDLTKEFPVNVVEISPRGYAKARMKAKKNWIIREIKRRKSKQPDTYSTATTD